MASLLGASQYLQETLPDTPMNSALFRAGLPGKAIF
jgi:hypothetical protein